MATSSSRSNPKSAAESPERSIHRSSSSHAPVATDGGHTVVAGTPEVYIEEMVGVYHADFDAPGALVDARRSMEICGDQQFTVTSMRGRKYLFHLLPQRRFRLTGHRAVVLQGR